jgi:hypothetical protein
MPGEFRDYRLYGLSLRSEIPLCLPKQPAGKFPISRCPSPNEDSRIDRRIIALMDEKLTLGEIGSRILAEFPSRFKDWYAALTRAGDLSERYSK